MITFREALDGLRNVAELLKTGMEAESSVARAASGMSDLKSMLESPRIRNAASVAEVTQYIDRVVLPQLVGLHDALKVGSEDPFKRLRSASEQVERVIVRLQMLVDGTVDGLL